MRTLLKNPSQIVTVSTNGKNFKRGNELRDISILENHSLIFEKDRIIDFIPYGSISNESEYKIIDVKDKVLLPGLVECHTHTAFAGSRAKEFRSKLAGTSYEEIAKLGGGINTTVSAVRNASFDELVRLIIPRINYFISQGITSLEIKSGYGLDFGNEIKLLRVIHHLQKIFPITIIPTFLGAHAIPIEMKNNREAYLEEITHKMLPFIAENSLAKFCDGFCELTAFSTAEIDVIFSKAKSLGFDLKLHTDQFNAFGGIEVALNYDAVSVDHLEVIKENDIAQVADSDAAAVLLPGVSFFLNDGYAPARKLIDAGAIVALSTDYNPGSSNIANLNLIMSLAVLKMKMTIEETISAVTINAAKALKINEDVGSIEIGKKADFSVFNTNDYTDIVYNVGKNLNELTIKNGGVIYKNKNE
ncbi:MAG: imidazolonepropionase [Ignavibacteria bacterium]|nr:imidazolonepropionase [Ignavibacteria bacterium]PIS44294.1 MAG: imidazolonepropionase [Ignavibacteria bacterium CG08_land_8_20_14_0_20_37_9]PIX93048.1 MAG: imidazolonepropionase [Ignavibacteria bacterium CG_4_10_14_3_um_filter_37_18]